MTGPERDELDEVMDAIATEIVSLAREAHLDVRQVTAAVYWEIARGHGWRDGVAATRARYECCVPRNPGL